MINSPDHHFFEAVQSTEPVSGHTHDFYRYPARFSPQFVRAVIQQFSAPGDLILDPFAGGGTTLVEAITNGREAVGIDVNPLSVFISSVKTRSHSEAFLAEIVNWGARTLPLLKVRNTVGSYGAWRDDGYLRNINGPDTWRLRKLIQVALDQSDLLPTRRHREFARCILLKTSQWALDCRESIPAVAQFRSQFLADVRDCVSGARTLRLAVRQSSKNGGMEAPVRATCLLRSAIGLEKDRRILSRGAPRLVVTSPPYPGVHVLYHRWQVTGRRETPAPFWIAGKLDGSGEAYYTFGSRKERELTSYYKNLYSAFSSLAGVVAADTLVVQLVAFSDISRQLGRYLSVMEDAGFVEIPIESISGSSDGRLWRRVPNRKWYASKLGFLPSANEVVLFHRLRVAG